MYQEIKMNQEKNKEGGVAFKKNWSNVEHMVAIVVWQSSSILTLQSIILHH